MATISGSVSGNRGTLVARVKSSDGQVKSRQTISPSGGGFSFATDEGDTMDLVPAESDTQDTPVGGNGESQDTAG